MYDYSVDMTIFDLKEFRRKICLSELLDIQAKSQIAGIINKIDRNGCDILCLYLDYVPSNTSEIGWNFYIKRSLQIYQFLQSRLNHIVIKIMCSPEVAIRYEKFCIAACIG